ncbi:hypothetical protein HY375_03950 [Candidatus Berkelbacteria bacterium]|nr:hypothetical protein [Candidatus Berkelbacteria bacterium]
MEPITALKAELVPLGNQQTIRAMVTTEHAQGAVTIPAGISVGAAEAKLIDPAQAVQTIHEVIGPVLVGKDCLDQRSIDQALMDLDGTADRSHLGVNALLPVSLAVARAAAAALSRELYEQIAELANTEPRLPETIVVALEGGKHAPSSGLTIQEFSLVGSPATAAQIIDALDAQLRQMGHPSTTGGEGGLVLSGQLTNQAALQLLLDAAIKSGTSQPQLALDVAASHGVIPEAEVRQLVGQFPIAIIEDPLEQENLEQWQAWTKEFGTSRLIAADDLTVGNPRMIKDAVQQGVANCLVVKLNQTATLSELLDLVDLVRVGNWKIVVSHRGLETDDAFITDLAVGIGAEYLKAGSLRRPERKAKYDRLAAIRIHLQQGTTTGSTVAPQAPSQPPSNPMTSPPDGDSRTSSEEPSVADSPVGQ